MQRPEVISVPELRQFGFALAVLVVLLFVGLLPWVRDAARPLWPWIVSAALGLAAGLAPATLRPVYRGWFPIALALAWFNTRFLLGIVFFALMTPLGTV
ncbi:MAG: SxtJ family membrane protein, partial [Chromatiales bacterium]|nr:SxtJ family membrane protein [Chromatiales bacterium]